VTPLRPVFALTVDSGPRRRGRRRGAGRGRAWAIGCCVLASGAGAFGPAGAQPLREPREQLETPEPPGGGPEVDASCLDANLFGGTELEKAAWCHARADRWASVRTLARRVLDAEPTSTRGHYLMGLAQHLGEANLPKARYHLQRAEALFEQQHRGLVEAPELAMLERRILLELVYVHGEMDDHEGKIRYVDRLKRKTEADYSVLSAWPLLKLERFDEAREVARAQVDSEHAFIRSIARTALCAIESEMRNRRAAYEACRAAAEAHASDRSDGAVEYTNAGASAEELGRLDEAERYYLEATLRTPEGTVNPWTRLVQLYVRQGRFAEALTSWKRLVTYRERRPNAHLRQQDEADAASAGAVLLLLAGRVEAAARVTGRLVDRPDRKGTSSAAAEQAEGGLALLDHVAQRAWANRLDERAAVAGWSDWASLKLDAAVARYRAWASGRRVLKILADRERLETTLRPEAPGSLEGPTWLDPEVVGLVGPGVARGAIAKARAAETLPPERAEPVFALLEAETHAEAGRWAAAAQAAEAALRGLLASDVMARARAHLQAGRAAARRGDAGAARRHYQRVLEADPGLFLRLGVRVPVRILAAGPSMASLAEGVEASPRFAPRPWGFALRLDDRGAILAGDAGVRLARVSWPAREPGVGPAAHRRRCLNALHTQLLAPPIDLSQADVRSLDGTVGGGVRADDLLDAIMKEAP